MNAPNRFIVKSDNLHKGDILKGDVFLLGFVGTTTLKEDHVYFSPYTDTTFTCSTSTLLRYIETKRIIPF